MLPSLLASELGEHPLLRRLYMKKESYLATHGIPGIAAKGEIIKVTEEGILVGRWLPMSKYPQLMKNRQSLRAQGP